ncbi:MAG: hypothetical protein M0Z80_07930, partial [Treponema sp.]|nr:hypothetical protein [Treponema sp.]
ARAAAQKAAAAPGAAASGRTGLAGIMMGGPGGPPPGSSRSAQSAQAETASIAAASSGSADLKTLWYLDGAGKLAVHLVRTGVTDGSNTELVGADSLEGRRVIVKIKVD